MSSSSVTLIGLGILGLVLAGYVAQKYLPPPPPKIVGIDLGTTYSSIAVYHAVTGDVEVIEDEHGRQSIPSVVCFLENGTILVGDDAVRQSEHHPTRTFYDAKRFIGKRFDREEFLRESSRYPFQLSLQDDGFVVFRLDDPKRPVLTPEEIGSFVLSHLKRMAELKLGSADAGRKSVMSVPAEFDDLQRNATRLAANLAGMDVYRIINEPTAAALAYGLHRKAGVDHVLIFDLGGGTLDVSLLAIQGGMLITTATAGNNHLGGQDFTQRLFQRLNDVIRERFGRPLEDKEELQNLRMASESAKLALTNETWTELRVPLRSISPTSELHYVVTRDEFEEINADLFRKVLKPVEATLADVGASRDDVDEVVLVGGSTRIPKLRRIIGEYFGKEPNYDIDPELAVVTGVAVQSGVVTGGWPLQVSATELPNKLRKIHVYD